MVTDLRAEQRRVRLGALPALGITVAVFSLAAWWGDVAAPDTIAMSHAVGAMLVPAACVAIAIANVANGRYFSAVDIDSAVMPDCSPDLAIARAILTNTLEQAFLAVIVYAALGSLLPSPSVLLAAMATLFVVGRLFFALGYRRGAGGRAFGFGLTFYPTVIGLGYAIFLALT